MRFMMSALRRSLERRFLELYSIFLVPYLGCVLLHIFVDGDLYKNPGFTKFIVWFGPPFLIFTIVGIGVDLEVKARRSEKNSDKKIEKND